MVELLINNVYIPVDSITTDIGTNDIGTASAKTGDVSASFDINATPENLSAFNGVFNRRVPAQIINGGVIQSSGYVLIASRNLKDEIITLDYFGEVSDIVALLGDITLRDLDWSEYNHDKNATTIQNSWSNTEGYMYPLLDLGTIERRVNLTFGLNECYPAIFLKTAIKKMLENIGYTLKGTILSDYVYNNAILYYLPEQQDANGIGNTYTQTKITYFSNTFTFFATDYIRLNTVTTGNEIREDLGGNIDYTTGRYIVPRDGLLRVSGYFQLDGLQDLDIKVNGTTIYTVTRTVNNEGKNFNYYLSVSENDYVEVECFLNGSTRSLNYDIRIAVIDYDPTGLVELNNYVEDIPCAEVFEFLTTYYCGLISVNAISKEVTINKVNDIINNIPSAIDWTGKINRGDDVKLMFNDFNGSYGQRTKFVHAEPNEDKFVEKYKGVLTGYLKIDNNTLNREEEFYESPFAPIVFDSSRRINIGRVHRYTLQNEAISYTAASTSSGLLQCNCATPHGLNIGDYVHLITSINGNAGTAYVIDVLTDNNFVTSTPYITTGSGVMQPYEDVKEVETRLAIYEGLKIREDFTTSTVRINTTTITQLPLVYSCLDLPNFENSGQRKIYVTWEKQSKDVNGITVNSGTGNGLLDEYWSDAKTILERGESLEASFYLDTIDVKDLDYSIPIYIQDTGAYYYVNKIDGYEYKKGFYNVTLIRL